MTSEHDESHRLWDELAAAQALHALERPEQLMLLAHIDTCPLCRDRLDDYTLISAQLGALAEEIGEPPSWADMRSGVLKTATEAVVVPLRRGVPRRLLAAAAGFVVVAASVAVGTEALRHQGSSKTAALTACRQQAGCRIIQLHGQHGDNAAVLIDAGHASLVPIDMPPLPADRMYVLWQMPRDGSPIPVTTSSDTREQTASVPLVTRYSDTAAFAVSLEPVGPMPKRPSDVLAVGAATT